MADIKCIMWNCSGLTLRSSAEEKFHFINTITKFDILALVETHHTKNEDIYSKFHLLKNKYHFISSAAHKDDPYAGILLLIDKRLTLKGTIDLIAGRLLNVNFSDGSIEYNMSVIYSYTGHCATQKKIQDLVDILKLNHNSSNWNILLGDLNFVENDLDRVSKSKLGMNPTDTILHKPWTQFTSSLDLIDPFRAKNPTRRMFSYIHTRLQSKSRIDRIYVNDENQGNITHYEHILTPFTTAHRMVSFIIKQNVERGPGYWKMNTSIITDRPFYLLIEKIIQDVSNLHVQDPIERWLIFKESVRIEARVYCTRKLYQEKKLKSTYERNIMRLEQDPRLASDLDLQQQHTFCLNKINECHMKQIDGHRIRTKTCPRFEYGEPNIAFFADMEKKSSKKNNISEIKDTNGNLLCTTTEIKDATERFYTNLYTTKKTCSQATTKLLKNVTKQISETQKTLLDREITDEELETTVKRLHTGKSPGPDGFPAEFYQHFWPLIKEMYKSFITEVKNSSFPDDTNMSVTTLIYKEKGEKYLLADYRPKALMNIDVKLLTKLLSSRLNLVLPNIIHETQTAIYGRRIGDSINLVRDLIDLANQNEEEAALLFLDQEKAFDRVNHSVLFKTMEKFGFGNSFISWIKIIYSNASTTINVNGFLTERIPLMSGVRQGCPLSMFLYILVIELLALKLRSNPNIVGFTIEGEKLISTHYSDDAVIKITQNRCFKEVYKRPPVV